MKNKEFLLSIKQCCVEILVSIKSLSDPPGEDDDEIFESTTQAIQKSAESMKFMSDLITEAVEDVDDEIEVKENLLEASNRTRYKEVRDIRFVCFYIIIFWVNTLFSIIFYLLDFVLLAVYFFFFWKCF
jgi:hypothetical protein